MKPLVSQLWPQFMADPDFAACFGQVIVEHARMLRQDRQVEFTLRSAAPLDQNLCARLLASLQPDYEGFELKIKNLFGYAMLDEHALRIPAGGHEAGRRAHQWLFGQEQHYHHRAEHHGGGVPRYKVFAGDGL